MMSSVLEQHISEFTRALIGNEADGEFNITSGIKPSSKIPPRLALEIYRNNTRGSRVGALEQIYPACKNILGDETFHAIAMAYVVADTRGTADLNHYGETFAQHLDVLLDSGRLPVEYAYLPDLASLEYCFHAAYYAGPDPLFDFELFENTVMRAEPIYLQLSSALGLLASSYPLEEIWLHNRPGLEPEANRARHSDGIPAIPGTLYLLVYRDEYTPEITLINEAEYRLLKVLDDNRSLQDSIDDDINVLLPGLIANKWIVGIKQHE